jgi:hypothetical protein
MAVETQFPQISHEALSAPGGGTSLLPSCCVCGFIRDETSASHDQERWVTPRTYRKTHGVNPADCLHTHTYCPGCLTQVMETIKTAQVLTTLAVA